MPPKPVFSALRAAVLISITCAALDYLFYALPALAQAAKAKAAVPAAGEADECEKTATAQFAQGKYKDAAANLRLAIYKGAKSAGTWLLLGQSYEGAKEYAAARQSYETVQKYFPGTTEAARAAERSLKLGAVPATGAVGQKAGSVKSTSGSQAQASTATGKPLKERIFVVPPKFGHLPVDVRTIALIRTLVAGLPRSVYEILDQGKTNIYLTPNLIDRFPEAAGELNEHLGCYFSEEHGRTYGRDVYLAERRGRHDGSTTLNAISDDETLKEFFYAFTAHALNDCLESPSKDPQFVQLYRAELSTLDPNDPRLNHCFAPVEGVADTFAALSSSIMGSKTTQADYVSQCFPRCRLWILQRIRILSGKIEK